MNAIGADVALRDGSTVHVRPTTESDAAAVADLIAGLTTEGRWLRFMGKGGDPRRTAARLLASGPGLVATVGAPERVVGHACLVPQDDDRAEIAFEVADAWQARGIATALLAHLAESARELGITTLTALVHPSNRRMLSVFRESGFPIEVRAEPCALEVVLPAHLGREARTRFESRDDLAAVAAVRHVLAPSSVAVVGASRRRGSIGGTVVRNLVSGGFVGELYPVNPHARRVAGRRAYPSLSDVPGPVELAVVALPAEAALAAARACAASGVRALLVLSAGFGEAGAEGRARQEELLAICRGAGMRLVGPNCLGVLNTDPAVALNATFAPGTPPPGGIAFASQSGAYGIAALELTARRGLGLSSFVSLGDKADLSGNDVLRFWERDPRTDVVLLYLESLGNPRRFGRIARRVSTAKPIVAVKSGRSMAGRRAASSHTGALVESSEATVDALFEHAGVIRVDTLDEQLDVAALLTGQPLPRGGRVAIVSNAGGPGIACADACVAGGLQVEPFGVATRSALAAALPAAAAVGNPVDLLATASDDDFRCALNIVTQAAEVDAVVAIFIPPLPGRRTEPVLHAVRAAAGTGAVKPVLFVVMPPGAAPATAGVPVYETPEQAARALSHAVRYARRRSRPDAPAAPPADVEPDRAAAVLAAALGHPGGWLEPEAAAELCAAYGIPLAPARVAASPHEAGRCAAVLGGEVALKAILPDLIHKSDVGAVRLGLSGAGAVERAASELRDDLGAERFLVQAMVPAGVEMLVGAVSDARFGPVVACGAGGTAAELLGDVQVRLAPVGEVEANEMVRALRTFPLLDGYRGAPRADVRALVATIVRVGALVGDQPTVAELDLNPVVVSPSGAMAADVRVRVAPAAERPPFPSLGGWLEPFGDGAPPARRGTGRP